MIGLRKFRLVSADARRGETHDEFLRESAGEATGGIAAFNMLNVFLVN